MNRLKANPFNGLYQFSFNLGHELATINSEHLNLHFYVPSSKKGVFGERAKYVTHRSIDKFYKFNTSKFDVWHITTQISWYRPFNKKTKVIFTLHDLNFLIEEQENTSRNQRLLTEIQKRIDRSDYIVGISKFVLEYAAGFLNFRNKPTSVIYNGCNKLLDPPLTFTPRYFPARPFLFSVGLVQPRKNFHTLPALLMDNDFELIIAGINDFGYGDIVIKEAKKYGVSDRVRLIGPISEIEKSWYYKNCTAFLFPSYAEGFGLPILEAMQFGKPVFLANRTSLPEIGGPDAFYFNGFDIQEMQTTFADGMHAFDTIISEKLKKRAEEFNWTAAATAYIDLYEKI